MVSSSRSASETSTSNRDGRVAADNGALGVSADGDVTVNMIPDEMIELGQEALADMLELAQGSITAQTQSTQIVATSLGDALTSAQNANKSEAGQISEQLIKVAVPAAAIAFIASRVL